MAIQVLSAKVTIGHAADMALKKDVLDWVSWVKDYLGVGRCPARK